VTAGEVQESPCPSCGELVSITLATSETKDQLAGERTQCPRCGAALERAIEGHVDSGWRITEESTG
jgi:endogenous inhibitor of DNA gyrase (YacG/DUF329 family)